MRTLTSTFAVIIWVIITCIGCSAPEAPTQTHDGTDTTSSTRINYKARLVVSTARYRDTVRIYGEHFGNRTNRIAVYVDNISILPVQAADTMVAFVIPTDIPRRIYHVSIKIVDDEVKDFAQLEILTNWGAFIKATITARLYCDSTNYLTMLGAIPKVTKTYTFGTVVVPLSSTKYCSTTINNNLLICDYTDSISDGEGDKYTIVNSHKHRQIHVEIDTVTKTAFNISIYQYNDYSVDQAVSASYSTSSREGVKVRSGTYTEIAHGIEIIIPSSALEQSLVHAEYYHYDSRNNPLFWTDFIPKPPFQDDNYVKIVLERE